MNAPRNELRTGVLVVLTLAILVAALLYLGAPGVFVRLNHYFIYFENASGIKPGADVMVAGRKVGQVRRIFSPVPEKTRPGPKYESLVEVQVAASAGVYNKVRAQLTTTTLLGDVMVDFSNGEESSGLASNGTHFIGEKTLGLNDVAPKVMETLDPLLVDTRKFVARLNELSAPGSPLSKSLENIQELTAADGPLSKTFQNAERITGNQDIEQSLQNFRMASEKLKRMMNDLTPRLRIIATNLEEASDTIKRQPWRLVWPSTKRSEEDGRVASPQQRQRVVPVRKP